MKEFEPSKQNIDMTIDERLRQADPARNLTALDQDLVLRAAQRASARGMRARFSSGPWASKGPQRLALGLSGFVAAVAVVVAVVALQPAVRVPKTVVAARASSTSGANLPALTEPIRYSAFGPYASPKYSLWSQALEIPEVISGVALVTKNVTVAPSASLINHAPETGVIYKLMPTQTFAEAGKRLAQAFGVGQPLRASQPARYGSITVTAGSVPPTPVSFELGQPNSRLDYRGVAAIWSKNGVRWVYGNSQAMAWRDCKPGDSMKKNVSIISRMSEKNLRYCRVLPSGMGPTSAEALARAGSIFQSLGYRTSTTLASTPNGGLYLVAQGFGEQSAGRQTYYQATISGYLKVAGQVTTLAQKVMFTSSSQQIVSAQGFMGNVKTAYVAKLKSPAQAARQISIYDTDPVNSIQLFDPKAPGSYLRSDLSTSILKAPVGDPSRPTANPVTITVSKFRIVPGVIEARDGTTWLIPSYLFTDKGGYLGAVKALPNSLLKRNDYFTSGSR